MPKNKKKTPKINKTSDKYEPPKITKFEKLEKLIVAGE